MYFIRLIFNRYSKCLVIFRLLLQCLLACCLLLWLVYCVGSLLIRVNPRLNLKPTNEASFCSPKKNIVFLKIHKTGSTTVMNILQRYGITNSLNFVLPKAGHYLGKSVTLSEQRIMPLLKNESYNILCNHVIYNRTVFHTLLPKGNYYFTILREPLSQFISAFWYYRNRWKNKYLLAVPEKDSLNEYLKKPLKYESLLKNPGFSYTNNRMSYDLGLKQSDFQNEDKIAQFISDLDEDFHLVLITEYFDISMVLLKRKLCWQLKDILYIKRNVSPYTTDSLSLTEENLKRHKNWDKADYIIYKHYLKIFWNKVKAEENILSEVHHYQWLLYQTKKFCTTNHSPSLLIEASIWNREMFILRKDCNIMLQNELELVKYLQIRHRQKHTTLR